MSKLFDALKRARGDAPVNRLAKLVQAQNKSLAEINLRLTRLEAEITARPGTGEIIQSLDPDAWSTVAQKGELDFHKRRNMRSSQTWEQDVARDWQELGFAADGWQDKVIIDVGAGSRLRTLYFKGATIVALEPLADKFADEVDWQDIDRAAEIYAEPVEKLIPGLVGRGDLIVSINALDHGFDFATGIGNIRKYAKPDATVFLSFDAHDKPDHMHPLVLNDGIVRSVFDDAGFQVLKSTPRRRYHGASGPGATNYWLKPV